VEGNQIGTNTTGNGALPNAVDGVRIIDGASGNTIGGARIHYGDQGTLGNLISGNASAGVLIFEATGNAIQGNFIGTDRSGTQHVPNGTPDGLFAAVALFKGALDNLVGGPNSVDGQGRLIGLGNLISGNNSDGIFIGDAFARPQDVHV